MLLTYLDILKREGLLEKQNKVQEFKKGSVMLVNQMKFVKFLSKYFSKITKIHWHYSLWKQKFIINIELLTDFKA